MHNLTYSVSSLRSNSNSNFGLPVKQKSHDKKSKAPKHEKDFSTLTLYKIAMSEVFEKHNDLARTRPFQVLTSANLAFAASKFLFKKKAGKFETFYSQKLAARLVADAVTGDAPALLDRLRGHPKLSGHFERNGIKVEHSAFDARANVELLDSTLLSLSDLKSKEAIQEVLGLSLFRRSLAQLDGSALEDRRFAFQLLKLLKAVAKYASKEQLAEFRNFDFVRPLLNTEFEDKKANAFKALLSPFFAADQPALNGGPHAEKPLAHPRKSQTSLPGVASGPLPPPRTEPASSSSRIKSGVPFVFLFDPEMPSAQRSALKETAQAVAKQPAFRALVRPFFELLSEKEYFDKYVSSTFADKELMPHSLEEMPTYFPNFHVLTELLHKELPQHNDVERGMFAVNALFTPRELNRGVGFEDYVTRVAQLVSSQDKLYVPYLLAENNYIRFIVSEVVQGRFVVVNVRRNAS